MANYDFVMPYDERMAAFLRQCGYPHPPVIQGNRLPTQQDVLGAIKSTAILEVECTDDTYFFAVAKGSPPGAEYKVRFDTRDWDRNRESDVESFTMHGCFDVELHLLEILSHGCGQLLLYPDSGAPAVVVEPSMDALDVTARWHEALKDNDSWACFYESIYGPQGIRRRATR